MELMDVSRLYDVNECTYEGLPYLLVFGVLEVKYDLYRACRKQRYNGKRIVCIGVAPDVLAGSVHVSDHWHND